MAGSARQASAEVARDSWGRSLPQHMLRPWGQQRAGGGSQFPGARRKEPLCGALALLLVDWNGNEIARQSWGCRAEVKKPAPSGESSGRVPVLSRKGNFHVSNQAVSSHRHKL